jgi:AcrR family transcriptional regulator
MIQSALLLMGEQGIEATSFSQVIEHSGAPRGSIYHHFPGGKAQLVEEATRYAGKVVEDLLAEAVRQHDNDPVAAVDAIASFWRDVLFDSKFAAGCPVIAATLESDSFPSARAAAGEVFARWEYLYTKLLGRAGVPEQRARSLAAMAISSIEGAVILSRAQRSNEPLERVADEVRSLFRMALENAKSQ